MTSPRSAPRPRAPGASLSSLIIRGASLPRWVFRALSVARARRYADALTGVVPDLRPQIGLPDYRYDA